jgi:hypothetical protein
MRKYILEAAGTACEEPFVMETLPTITRILEQDYVLAKYAQVLDKPIQDIKKALESPPQIRFDSVKLFNAFVDAKTQIRDENVNGWFWGGVCAGGGFRWLKYLNVNEHYYSTDISSFDADRKKNHQVFFICTVLHQLAHWLRFKLEGTNSPDTNGNLGTKLELELFGGRMATYYFESHGNESEIDGVALMLSEQAQDQSESQTCCRPLSKEYLRIFFEDDIEKLVPEVEIMRRDLNSGLPPGTKLKTPLCGCEVQGNEVFDPKYQIKIAHRQCGTHPWN